MFKNFSICFLLIFSFTFCQKKKIEDYKTFVTQINNPENGLVKVKNVGELTLTAKFLPPAFLAYQEYKKMKLPTSKSKDSLIKYYSNSHSFLLTIAVNEDKTKERGDLLTNDISSYDEYKERFLELTFNLTKYVDLQVGNETYEPVLSTMINDFGLSSKKDFYLVYANQAQNKENLFEAKELDLIFYDELFHTGKSHFVFTKEELENLPEFDFK